MERCFDFGKFDAARSKEDKQMIQQVGRLGDQPVAPFADRGEDRFDRLLAELLGAIGRSAIQQLSRVGRVAAAFGALGDPLFEVIQSEIGHDGRR